jgi:hypothetical protein
MNYTEVLCPECHQQAESLSGFGINFSCIECKIIFFTNPITGKATVMARFGQKTVPNMNPVLASFRQNTVTKRAA